MGSCGGTMSYTTFGTWGKGVEADTKIFCLIFYLFTLSINNHKPYSNSMCFSSILAENYESYLIYVK